MRRCRLGVLSTLLSFLFASSGGTAFGQQPKRLDNFQVARAHMMLRTIYDEIKKKYYDPTFHGIDLEGMYAKADAAIDKSATNTDAFFLIATFVSTLNDSHTFFIPPEHINQDGSRLPDGSDRGGVLCDAGATEG